MSASCRSLVVLAVLCFVHRGAPADEPPAPKPLDAKELDALWADLADSDAVRAYRAICRLAVHPGQSVPFLRTRLRPVPPLDEKLIAALIAGLDNESFEEREKAQKGLEGFGGPVRPPVLKALAGQPTPEAKRRLDAILQRVDEQALSAEALRHVRAVEALERMGTAEARQFVKELAGGAPGARLTREAESSLSRMPAKP
jgi:hypothetical protein